MIFIARRTWNEVKAIYFSPHQISILPKLFSTYKINRPRCCQCDRDFAIFKGLCGKCCENIWQLFRLFWKHRFLVQAAVARQVVTLVFSLNCMLLGRSSILSPLVLSRLTVWGLYARKITTQESYWLKIYCLWYTRVVLYDRRAIIRLATYLLIYSENLFGLLE